MFEVGVGRGAESLFCAFHEVVSAAAMGVYVNASWYYIASFGIDDLCVHDVQVNV